MFVGPEEAIHALAISRDFFARCVFGFDDAETFEVDKKQAVAILSGAVNRKARQLNTVEAFQVLSCYGIPVAPWSVAVNAEEAAVLASELGFPVAMKVMGEAFLHKSDVGGVLLQIESEAEVLAGYARLADLNERFASAPWDTGILIQQMAFYHAFSFDCD